MGYWRKGRTDSEPARRLTLVLLPPNLHFHRLMTGPVHTLQGGMQETLLNTAMTWAAATGAIDDGVAKRNTRGGPPQVGTLKFVEVNYKARVTVPGYYRIRADVVDVKRDGSDTVVYDLESVIQELQKGNKWVTLGTGKSQRVFKTPAPNPSPHPRKMFRGAARKMRIDRPVWSETDTFLKAAPGRFLVFDADVERKPGWVKEGAGGFPWRTCFGEGRITKMSAIYDPAAQQMEGSSYFDSGVEGIENGGGFVSPDAFFSILDYWMVETSRQWMTSAGTMQSGGGSVTASMKLTPISLPRVPCLLHYVTKVSWVVLFFYFFWVSFSF